MIRKILLICSQLQDFVANCYRKKNNVSVLIELTVKILV